MSSTPRGGGVGGEGEEIIGLTGTAGVCRGGARGVEGLFAQPPSVLPVMLRVHGCISCGKENTLYVGLVMRAFKE